MTIGVIATNDDRLAEGRIGMTTILLKIPQRDIDRDARMGLPKGEAIDAIQECFESNRHIAEDGAFGSAVATYIGQTQNYDLAEIQGLDGYSLKLSQARGVSTTTMFASACTADPFAFDALNLVIQKRPPGGGQQASRATISTCAPYITIFRRLSPYLSRVSRTFLRTASTFQPRCQSVGSSTIRCRHVPVARRRQR
jgi:hypothetical protein